MLVDRNLILDLIALEPKRETDIDTLIVHCNIINPGEQENMENCMKNIHVQTLELIEESFDSTSWFVLFLCVLMLCS
jgi:hypothetical protein